MGRGPVARARAGAAIGIAAAALAGCTKAAEPVEGLSSFDVTVTRVNGADPPDADAPLPANRGDVEEEWSFRVEARDPAGQPVPFDGFVRLSVRPGAVNAVEGSGAEGRNIRLKNGVAEGVVRVVGVYGEARLWVEDIGYEPAPDGRKAACSNGENDDDEDVQVDFPNDPGCAFADDDSEIGGTFGAGISGPVHYALPRIADIQGGGSVTPYPFEGMEVNTKAPQRLVVTRVATDGFYVTDLRDAKAGFNSIFAFSFSTPPGMRVCDRVVFLSGTVVEFFGFTEMSFPSFRVDFPVEGEACEVPEPTVLTKDIIEDGQKMESLESALVRLVGFGVVKNLGPKAAVNNKFLPDQTSCDLNGDGAVDFESDVEASCANACADDPECSEWTTFAARGNYKVRNKDGVMMQINTGTITAFDPTANRGAPLDSVTGTLRHFSGGSLNWTVEARCPDDLACKSPGCVEKALPSSTACVRLRSQSDNDEGTN